MALRDVLRPIVETIRESGLPAFVEIPTFRSKEHVGPGDDFVAGYRSEDEHIAWNSKDPLCVQTELVGRLTPYVMEEIDRAVEFAEASREPGFAELLTDVT